MNFIPEQTKTAASVPYFEDVSSDAGWQGQTTNKTIATLKSEITASISRLGGMIVGFQKGIFNTDDKSRDGFRIHYTIETPDGKLIPGRIDIAALPTRPYTRRGRGAEITREERSLRMSLYMFRMAMDGQWFLQQLSPGYAPLMPFMLATKDQTVSQLWSEGSTMKALLPPSNSDFIDAEVV